MDPLYMVPAGGVKITQYGLENKYNTGMHIYDHPGAQENWYRNP